MKIKKMIGIVGGVGSYAGIDLIKKIYDQTNALSDQEHLPISMLSIPEKIWDKTDYLCGLSNINPGPAMANIITQLHHNGAALIGIPCNTAHAPAIFNAILKNTPPSIRIIHMIHEVVTHIKSTYPHLKNIGILSTTGTLNTHIYPNHFEKHDINTLQMTQELQELYVHPAIYDKTYGIKAQSNPPTTKAKEDLLFAANYLIKKGAEAIILGCTELPLAIQETHINAIPIIDATKILAHALVRESSPNQIKPKNNKKERIQ